MFTLAEIDEVHHRLGRADSLPAYLAALHELGVETVDSFVTDGHSVYAGGGQVVEGPAHHEEFEVAAVADAVVMRGALAEAAEGGLGYVEMSRALAGAGVERWRFDTAAATITYVDAAGAELLVEQVG